MTTVWQTFGIGVDAQAGATVISRRGILGIAVDFTHSKIWFRWSPDSTGDWNGASTATQNPATNTGGFTLPTGTLYPAWSGNDASGKQDVATLNTGAIAFVGSLPSGFSAWNTSGTSTWNPSDKSANVTLSNGNLTATQSSASSTDAMVRGTSGQSSGLLYFEISLDDTNSGASIPWMGGVANASEVLTHKIGQTTNSTGVGTNNTDGIVRYNNASESVAVYNITLSFNTSYAALASTSHTSGKWYFELSANAISSASATTWIGGVANSSASLSNGIGNDINGSGFSSNAAAWHHGDSGNNVWTGITAGHVMGVAVDVGDGLMWVREDNGAWSAISGTGDPVAGTGGLALPTGALFPAWSGANTSGLLDQATLVTSSAGFTYTPPTGYSAWDLGSAALSALCSAVAFSAPGGSSAGNPLFAAALAGRSKSGSRAQLAGVASAISLVVRATFAAMAAPGPQFAAPLAAVSTSGLGLRVLYLGETLALVARASFAVMAAGASTAFMPLLATATAWSRAGVGGMSHVAALQARASVALGRLVSGSSKSGNPHFSANLVARGSAMLRAGGTAIAPVPAALAAVCRLGLRIAGSTFHPLIAAVLIRGQGAAEAGASHATPLAGAGAAMAPAARAGLGASAPLAATGAGQGKATGSAIHPLIAACLIAARGMAEGAAAFPAALAGRMGAASQGRTPFVLPALALAAVGRGVSMMRAAIGGTLGFRARGNAISNAAATTLFTGALQGRGQGGGRGTATSAHLSPLLAVLRAISTMRGGSRAPAALAASGTAAGAGTAAAGFAAVLRGIGAAASRATASRNPVFALAAIARAVGMMRGGTAFPAALAATGQAQAQGRGLMGFPALLRAILRSASQAQTSNSHGMALSARGSFVGNITPSAEFLAPLAARNVLTLTITDEAAFAAGMAAQGRAGLMARAGAAFAAVLKGRGAGAAQGQTQTRITAALFGRSASIEAPVQANLFVPPPGHTAIVALVGRLAGWLGIGSTMTLPAPPPVRKTLNPNFEIIDRDVPILPETDVSDLPGPATGPRSG